MNWVPKVARSLGSVLCSLKSLLYRGSISPAADIAGVAKNTVTNMNMFKDEPVNAANNDIAS